MGKFEEISRELGYTFTELQAAQGTAKRRCLRKAHLLLLLADELIIDAEGSEPAVDHKPLTAEVADPRSLPRAFVEDVLHSAERGPCRGLQTVLVLRQRSGPARNPEVVAKSRAPRA